jgi:hypothetical protein
MESLAEEAMGTSRLIVHLADFGRARRIQDLERLAWLQRRFETAFLEPILDQARKVPTRLFLAALAEHRAVVGVADSEQPRPNGVPFDERAWAENPQPGELLHMALRSFFQVDGPESKGR